VSRTTPPLRSPAVTRPCAAISWSGGKDSCLALLRAQADYDVIAMLTMFGEDGGRSRSHGLRPEVIGAQAARLGLHSFVGRCSWDSYTAEFARLIGSAAAIGVTHVIFGDIECDAHRAWDERVCAEHGLVPVLPLWQQPTRTLAEEFIDSGGTAIIVTTRATLLDDTWLGRPLTLAALKDLERRGIDACGENGEYHTLVTHTPLFDAPLDVRIGSHEMHADCWALDVSLAPETEHAAR